LAIPAIASTEEEYSDVLLDEEGDVFHWHGAGLDYDVERPNIDIIRAELSESGGIITISLTVKGEITDDQSISYTVYLDDEDDGLYYYTYTNGSISMIVSNDRGFRNFQPDTTGVGTDTLNVTCSLDDLLNPDSLRFSSILTFESTEDGWYQDTASPEDLEFLPIDYELVVEPRIGEAPLEVEITISAENSGDAGGEIPLTVDGEPIYTMELGAQEWKSEYTSHTFDEAGVYTLEFGDQSVMVYVQGDSDDEMPDTPYSDVVTDPEGDVMRMVEPTEEDWEYVESPDIDLIRIEISESSVVVTVSLRVKGTIRDDPGIYYSIFMKDDSNGEFDIWYNDGDCEMTAFMEYDTGGFGNIFEPAVDGVGTDTLRFAFTREQIGSPEVLLISEVVALNEPGLEVDVAGPDAVYPGDDNGNDNGVAPPPDDTGDDIDDYDTENGDIGNGDGENGDVGNGHDEGENGKEENGDEDDEEKGFLSGYWWIIPIIIIGGVVGLALVMKMGNKGEPMQPRPGIQNQQQTYEGPQQDTPPPPPAKE